LVLVATAERAHVKSQRVCDVTVIKLIHVLNLFVYCIIIVQITNRVGFNKKKCTECCPSSRSGIEAAFLKPRSFRHEVTAEMYQVGPF
jgi:hypothetical protein